MKTSSKKWQKIRKIKGLRQFVTWYPRHVSENPGDMQKLIDGVNSQKIDLDSTESDIKAASVYNSAIDDSLYEVKNAVYPNYKAFFVWDNAK